MRCVQYGEQDTFSGGGMKVKAKTKTRIQTLSELIMDFVTKCMDDHVSAFGAMAAFFMLLSVFPFMYSG